MLVLFDQGTPAPLRYKLPGHEVRLAYEQGWATLQNGELLTAAEIAGFDVLVTTDRNLRYQQNLSDRKIAIIVLSAPSWPRVQKIADQVVVALQQARTNAYIEIDVPHL